MFTLPTGAVTFLFTDIEGSTHLIQHLGGCRIRRSPGLSEPTDNRHEPRATGHCWRNHVARRRSIR